MKQVWTPDVAGLAGWESASLELSLGRIWFSGMDGVV